MGPPRPRAVEPDRSACRVRRGHRRRPAARHMTTDLKPPRTAPRRSHVRTLLGAAVATGDGLLHQRGPDVARRLSARERRVEAGMAAVFGGLAGALLVVSSL